LIRLRSIKIYIAAGFIFFLLPLISAFIELSLEKCDFMKDSFSWLNHLEPYCYMYSSTGLAEAFQTLQKDEIPFALVVTPNQAQTLISFEQLADAPKIGNQTLSDFFDPLPPKLTLSDEWENFSSEQLNTLAEAIKTTRVPGVLIYRGEEIRGILSSKIVAEAMPTSEILANRGGSLGGTSTVGFRIYTCNQCGSIRIPATGEGTPPICPQNPTHGSMSLEP
jgi:hypothetical protein